MPAAEHDAAELLGYVRNTGRLPARHGTLTPAEQSILDELVARRAAREPLQHLTGRAGFRHRELEVGPGVFIPRPETEVLVDWALDVLGPPGRSVRPVVVDLCSGSGAIAAAIATEHPGSVVHAVECDEQAADWAQRNLAGIGVELHVADMDGCLRQLDGAADLVLANPPYIPLEAWPSVELEVREYDPPIALWAGQSGLDAIGVVARTAARLLRIGGWAGCEHAEVQGESAALVFTESGAFDRVRDRRDLAGRPRFVTARRR